MMEGPMRPKPPDLDGRPDPRRIADIVRSAVASAPVAIWLLIAALIAGSPRPARAWGRLGHRASARLAESRLSPRARAVIRDLLEPGESLADASTWADEHSRDIPAAPPGTYVNVPDLVRPLRRQGLPGSRLRRLQDRGVPRGAGRPQCPPRPAPPGPALLRPPGSGPAPADARRRSRRPRRQRPPAPVRAVREHQPAPGLGFRTVPVAVSRARRGRPGPRHDGAWPIGPRREAGPADGSRTGPTRAWRSAAGRIASRAPTGPSARATRSAATTMEANLPAAVERLAQSGVRLAAMLNEILD